MNTDNHEAGSGLTLRALGACRNLLLYVIASTAFATTMPTMAQDFPTKPIKLIVPYAPGGVTDAAARAIATDMSKQLGQQVVVDNRAGAGGLIGTDAVAKSPADGYTICFCASGVFVIQPHLGQKMPLDPIADLQPVTYVYDADLVLSVNANSKIRSMADLFSQAKAGGVTYASVGIGSVHHLGMESIARKTGGKFIHVAYKGDAPAITDLLGGQIDLTLLSTQSATNLAKSGKIRLLASTGNGRAPGLPELPNLAESGLKDAAFSTWIGMFVPAATPQAVVNRIHAAASAAIASPAMQEWMAAQGLRPNGQKGGELKATIRSQSERWGAMVRELNVKPE